MTVSYFYLLLILAISLVELIGGKEIFSNFDIRTILLWILIILANGIISICNRLDDLKRKWENGKTKQRWPCLLQGRNE